jgi:hypothetical protein
MLTAIFLLLVLAATCLSKVYTAVSELPAHGYDFIIVGGKPFHYRPKHRILIPPQGGTAGSVVANRLTENPDFTVLILEAGPRYVRPYFLFGYVQYIHSFHSNEGVVEAEAPWLLLDFGRQPIWSWNYTTTPQAGLNGRTTPYPRARTLGGCTAHSELISR